MDFFGEVDGDGADTGGAALDGGVVADFFADGEGLLEEFVQGAAGGAGIEGDFVGGFDLAEDFGLAQDHGVEPGDDAEEVAGGVGGGEFVGDEGLGLGIAEGEVGGEVVDEGLVGGAGVGVLVGGVDFDAVAGGEDDGFGEAGEGADLLDGIGHFGFGKGDALADLDGGGAVVEAEADEMGGIGGGGAGGDGRGR